MSLLHPGDTFPQLTLNIPGGQAIEVPGWFAGEFGVVLFNRGAWCPYCTAQLRAFQRAGESLAQAGIRVAALWVDDEKTTAEFTATHGLTFPLGHSADARTVAGLTGAFVNEDPLYLQSTGFVLDPQGTAISHSLSSLGFSGVEDVRVGKVFRISLANSGQSRESIESELRLMCEKLLANTVIETYSFTLED
jgi:phosphoribosylformylglycinamidine synthase PurS subunit